MTLRKPMRDTMPLVAEFVDFCREAIGVEATNQAIRRGLAGGSDFFARENGCTLGHPTPASTSFTADQLLAACDPTRRA
jgi:hypothetical protein